MARTALPLHEHAIRKVWANHQFALILLVVGVIAFHNCFSGQLVFDDLRAIVHHKSISEFWPDGPFTTGARRPVGHWTLWLNHQLHGVHPAGYHAVNLGIHLASGLLLFGIVRSLLESFAKRDGFSGSPTRLAFAVAAIWSVHPLQTQSVTYVIQRLESLMGMFVLASIYLYLRGRRSAKASMCFYAASIASFYLALGTKENAICAPFIILLLERAFLSTSWRQTLKASLVVVIGTLLPGAIWLAIKSWKDLVLGDSLSLGSGVEGLTSITYLGSQPAVIAHYVLLAFWPAELCIDYAWPPLRSSSWLAVMLSVIVLGLLGSLWMYFRKPAIGFFFVSFFVLLAPTSSFIPIKDLAVEHRMYLPLACIVTLTALAFRYAVNKLQPHERRSRRILEIATIAALILLTSRTIVRNRDYHDPVRLWTSTLQVNSSNPRAHHNLAICLSEQGDSDLAAAHFLSALKIDPTLYQTRLALGELYASDGKMNLAIEQYQSALKHDPPTQDALFNLAVCYLATGRDVDGNEALKKVVSADPGHALAWNQIGLVQLHKGNLAQAGEHFTTAIRLKPRDAGFQRNLAHTFERRGRIDDAVHWYRSAIDMDSRESLAHNNLAGLLSKQGDKKGAEKHFRHAIESEPNSVDIRLGFANWLAHENRTIDATKEFANAVRDLPHVDRTHLEFASFLRELGQVSQANDVLLAASRQFWNKAGSLGPIGVALARYGESAGAVRVLERNCELSPDSAFAHNDLAAAYLGAGRHVDAKKHFEHALKIDPSMRTSRIGLERTQNMGDSTIHR